VSRADLTPDQLTLPESISVHILEDDLVIADLTDCNPNVFYELGKRHAWGGKCIHLTQSIEAVPFDVKHYRVIKYDLNNPESLDEVRRQLTLQIRAVERAPSKLPLTPEKLIALTDATLVLDFHENRKGHYPLAEELVNNSCKKIFLMQRSSSIILGPEQGWGGEKVFYEALLKQIKGGTEFLHVVSIEGIINHIKRDSSVFPRAKEAISNLSQEGDCIGIAGPSSNFFIKKIPEEAGDPDLKADRQARALIVELSDGSVEGLLVADLGARQGWFHMKGPKIANFLKRCYDFYYECDHLTSQDLIEIKRTFG